MPAHIDAETRTAMSEEPKNVPVLVFVVKALALVEHVSPPSRVLACSS